MTVIGTGSHGTMNWSLTDVFNRTGGTGTLIDIGKGKDPGASRTYDPYRDNRDRN